MNLKTQLLRALRDSATLGLATGALTSCGPPELERGNEKPWLVNETNYTSTCLEDGVEYTEYPYEGWQQDVYRNSGEAEGRVIICAPQSETSCAPGNSLSETQIQEFLTAALGEDNGCDPFPYIPREGANVCGPVHDSAEECCYVMSVAFSYCVEGRPFTVDGLARLASITEQEGWCEPFTLQGQSQLPEALRERIVYAWAEAGTHEHASVASFAKFIMELMSLGAPRHLVDAATQAMADESRHAKDCFSIASAYAGKALGPDIMNVQGGLSHIEDEAAILRAAIYEACIGETLAASVAQWMAPRAADEGVREVFMRIAEEEGNHAELGWRFVQWMLSTRPHLIPVARACFEDAYEAPDSPWAAGMTQNERVLLAHGCVSEPLEDHLRRRAFHHIVRPCADMLFALLAQSSVEMAVM